MAAAGRIMRRARVRRVGMTTRILVAGVFVAAVLTPLLSAEAVTQCGSSGGHQLCVSVSGTTLSGNTQVTVTNSPNSGIVIASWVPSSGPVTKLITSFVPTPQTNDYSFVWPTQKYLDASGQLRVQFGATSATRVEIDVTLNNGNNSDFQHSPNDWADYLPGQWTEPSDPVVAAVGDGPSNEPSSNAVAAQVAAADPALFMFLGDIYEDGTFTENLNHYGVSALDDPAGATLWGKTAAVTQPTIGNHEYPKRVDWIDYFHGRPLFTSFSFGGVLFLDMNSSASMGTSSAQYQMARDAITDADAPPCIIGYWHIPSISGNTIKDGQRALWSLLANNGVDLILTGHAHSSAEYKPLDADFAAGTSDAHMVQLIEGSGGRGGSGALTGSRIAWAKGNTPGILALTLEGARSGGTADSLSWKFLNLAGSVLRQGSIECGGGSGNLAPQVGAGPDQHVTLPNDANLAGTATDDGLPDPPGTMTTTWSKVSGPGTVTFGDAQALSTTASFSSAGTYVLRLTADDSSRESSDDVTVTVDPDPGGSGNLVGNPGFESGTNGWDKAGSGSGVTLSQVSGGHSGDFAARLRNGGTATADCKLNDAPNWVGTTSAGTYTGTLWARADTAGGLLKAKLREFNGSTLVSTGNASLTLTTAWQRITVTYVPTQPGTSTLDMLAIVTGVPAGQTCFYADDVSLTLT